MPADFSDLVARLRDKSGSHLNGLYDDEAADAIEQLQRELSAALLRLDLKSHPENFRREGDFT